MTEPEALRYVQENLPEERFNLYAHDRGDARSPFIKRYYIGCGNHCYGSGNTWSEAVEALMLSSGKMKRAVRA